MSRPSPTIVVAGHACLDLIPTLLGPATFEQNSLTRIGAAAISTGGAVPNVGLALHRLGLRPRLITSVGDDALGKLLLGHLQSFDATYADDVVVRSGGTTSYSIVIAPPGTDRAFWHCPGTNDEFSPREIPSSAFGGAQWLHVGYPPVMAKFASDPRGTAELFQNARENENHLQTSLDFCSVPADAASDWRRWLSIVLPHVDVFAPSFEEMANVLGLDAMISQASVRAVVAELHRLGASTVVLKLGAFGLFFSDERHSLYVPAMEVSVQTTTGAGDCTIAGLIAALASGDPIETALSLAVAAGSASCDAADATSGVSAREVLATRVRNGWCRSDRLLFSDFLEVSL